jgi:hypothetical protein
VLLRLLQELVGEVCCQELALYGEHDAGHGWARCEDAVVAKGVPELLVPAVRTGITAGKAAGRQGGTEMC